jgi:Domain of Unknown Function (DUF748)
VQIAFAHAPGRAKHSHARWPRRLLIAVGIVVALLVIVRLLLDPIAAHYTRKALHDADGIAGDFKSVHVTIFGPGYTINQLKIIEVPGGDWDKPLLYAERAHVGIEWRQLLHRRVTARLRLDDPKFILTKRAPSPKSKTETPDVAAQLQQITPARVARIEVRNGEFLYRDLTAPHHPEIWVHDIEVAAENLATREGLAHGEPATVSASAKLGRSGDITLFTSADLFAKGLDLAGNFALRGWKVAELYDLEEPATKLQTPEGTLDLFAKFKVRDNVISGGVKPVLKNVKVRPTEDTFGNKLKAWVADTGLHLFSDRVPDRNAVATVIPITGRLDSPDVQLWPTVLGIVRNAFVEGISSGFTHLPPATSDKKEGVLSQTTQALKKDKGPPKAQPTDKKAEKKADKK